VKKRMGRPRLPDAQKRALQIRVCVTQAEFQRIRRAAEAQGVAVSALAREIVLRSLG
jgi:hypothetical protein